MTVDENVNLDCPVCHRDDENPKVMVLRRRLARQVFAKPIKATTPVQLNIDELVAITALAALTQLNGDALI